MKKLAIILGAGASHSINSAVSKALDNVGYRPPLTGDLFEENGYFSPILNKYPRAQVLASSISRALRSGTVGLEQLLKSYDDRLRNGEDSPITRQFLQIPLYLNDLLGEVSQLFTKQPDEYNILVNEAIDKTDQVLFLTLNYDTLLEIPLAQSYDINFSQKNDYISNPKWLLAKLHGSINWYHQFDSFTLSKNRDSYFSNLYQQALPLSISEDFIMMPIPGHQQLFIGDMPIYPAITVPVAGKYEYSCPPEIIYEAVKFLASCKNILIIGTAGNDKDLLDLLKANVTKGTRSLIVGREEKSVREAAEKFAQGVPQLSTNFSHFNHNMGFSGFIQSGEYDRFLARLQ